MISKLLFPHRCYHGGTMHRFKPRFTVIPGAQQLPKEVDNILFHADYGTGPELVAAMRGGPRELYRGDVCVWCGKVSNEQGTPS